VKISFIKQAGGALIPASDVEADRMTRFKTGEMYEVEIKKPRNPAFHRKMFAFFNFCFEYWECGREFVDEHKQREVFRNHLTVLAGFYDEFYSIKGDTRIEARSLSYSNMEPEEFESCYNAQVNAAMKHLFRSEDTHIYNQLMSFF
jgi:hypothetical protein